MSIKLTLITALTIFPFVTPVLAEIEIRDQYALSSNAMAGAAFMVIHNHGDTDDKLLGVTSNAAKRVELHTHIEDENGVMRMVHVEAGFILPAGNELHLKRGSNHVMFMGLTKPFKQDDNIAITFTFDNAGEINVNIPVDLDRSGYSEMSSEMDH